jgi:hypothetical protein
MVCLGFLSGLRSFGDGRAAVLTHSKLLTAFPLYIHLDLCCTEYEEPGQKFLEYRAYSDLSAQNSR